ncbi:hypothetical protein A9Q83_01390 [Alphaproteobacteria bacterium 46_93_T64]|nr:hypothetical protein A9Q83_01390 [Alphaproteobacteria bacterium 46_93_T64]
MPEQLLTVDDIAKSFDISADVVLFHVNSDRLLARKMGPFIRFHQVDVNEWADKNASLLIDPPTWNEKLLGEISHLDGLLLKTHYEHQNGPDWVNAVLQGDFKQIPDPLMWDEGAFLSMIIDGYSLAPLLGLKDCGDFANKCAEEASVTGIWSGSATELWICLFFEARRWRHYAEEPLGEEKISLDSLCGTLRKTLIAESSRK